LSIDFDGNELLLADVLTSDEDTVFADLETEEDKKLIRRALLGLGEREREIINMRFGLGGGREMTQKEVADALGISQSYISRLEKRIINELKEKLSPKW
jgi:RNA polymerase sporulation-specific sigma factor